MKEKKSPKKLEWSLVVYIPPLLSLTCVTTHPKPPPCPPPTHPPTKRTTVQNLYKEEFGQETFQEGWDFARRMFCEKDIYEKDILRERNFERRIWFTDLKNQLIYLFFKSLNQNWSIYKSSDWPNSLAQKKTFFSSICTCVHAHKFLESVNSEFYCTYIAQTGVK